VERVVEDDRLTELYRRYGPAIYARCRRILEDADAAEDATQETFLRVYRHVERAPSTQEALRWIYRIATNYCLNELRNDKRHRVLLDGVSGSLEFRLGEEHFLDRDLGRRLVLRAPAHVGTAAWLHHVDGLDQAEVAEVLGVSRRTVVNYLETFAKHARKFVTRSVA
jgi:RNA polymerase sigma-70 factor (ECF subfamily)